MSEKNITRQLIGNIKSKTNYDQISQILDERDLAFEFLTSVLRWLYAAH